MRPGGHLSRQEIAILIVSLVNVGVLAAAAFYRERRTDDQGPALRVRLGYLAISLGLCSQVLYGAMVMVWRYGWVPLDPGVNSLTHLEGQLSNIGGLLSAATVMVSFFGKGLRRLTAVWVGATTFYFWGLVGLGVALKTLFR